MKIGGFQPMTLSDYPGQIAAVVFTQGCNFRCPFCHNGTLLATDPPSDTLMPVALELGFDPVWFVVVMAVNFQTSFVTPPFGYALFYMKGIASDKLTTVEIYQSIIPFICLQITGLFLCCLFPELILVPASWIK